MAKHSSEEPARPRLLPQPRHQPRPRECDSGASSPASVGKLRHGAGGGKGSRVVHRGGHPKTPHWELSEHPIY